MKKRIFAAALSLLALSCSKNEFQVVPPENPIPAIPQPAYAGPDYFIPAFLSGDVAPVLKANTEQQDGIHFLYVLKSPSSFFFEVRDADGLLARLTPPPIVPDSSGYWIVSFPVDFKVPLSWRGKVLTITASNSSTLYTRYRVEGDPQMGY
jgi:hypothetical protein